MYSKRKPAGMSPDFSAYDRSLELTHSSLDSITRRQYKEQHSKARKDRSPVFKAMPFRPFRTLVGIVDLPRLRMVCFVEEFAKQDNVSA